MLKRTMMLALGATTFWTVPAMAQDGVLTIYGSDKCPTNQNGEEIVVCRRLDESERFRIPKEMRELTITPENESWAVRQQGAMAASNTGVNSCTNVGANSATGCFTQQARAAKQEWRTRRTAEQNLPLP